MKEQNHAAILETLKDREISPTNPITKILTLLPHFKVGTHPDKDKTPTKLLEEMIMHCENLNEHIFSTIRSLGEFLNVGILDKDIGTIGQNEICDMAHHIKMLGELGHALSDIEAIGRHELERREKEK